LRKTPVLFILASIALIALMVLPACGSTTEVTKTVTSPAVTVTASGTSKEVEKQVKVINPQGNYIPVETKGLSARIDSLAGKRVYFEESEANPRIMPALLKRLKAEYEPKGSTFHYAASASFGPSAPDDDFKKNAQCAIRGIAWCGAATTVDAQWVAQCELAGVPSVCIGFADQIGYFRNVCLKTGCPQVRWIDTPRIGLGPEAVAVFYDKVAKALTDPLTAKEKEAGFYSPPANPRIMFEGTMDEAQDFLQQTTLIDNCRMCPIAKYTDGLPVIIPTEEKVAAMLTGTTHKGTEVLATQIDSSATRLKGAQIVFSQQYNTTVEKVAVCAVMAGCKPQMMPAALAIAALGGQTTNCPGTSSSAGYLWAISGPYAKEIGMNAGMNAYDVGNPANMSLGRLGGLISVAIGYCITGTVRSDVGNIIHNVMFAEDLDGLPAGWETLAEESTYYDSATKKSVNFPRSESVVAKWGVKGSMVHTMHSPGSTRALQSGIGGFARYVLAEMGKPELENPPGTDNYLPLNPLMGWTKTVSQMDQAGGRTFLMAPNIAIMEVNAGFKKKAEIYQWLYDTYFITVAQYRNMGWFSFQTNEGKFNEPDSGKPYNDLDPQTKLHAYGSSPSQNCVVVANGFADENLYTVMGGRPQTQPIGVWK